MVHKVKVNAQALFEILSIVPAEYLENQQGFREARKAFLSREGHYDLQAHYRYIQHKASEHGVEKNVKISIDCGKEPYSPLEFAKPKLSIDFADVEFHFTRELDVLSVLSLPHLGSQSGTGIRFSSCKFTSDQKQQYHIQVQLHGKCNLEFHRVEFCGVNHLASFHREASGHLTFRSCDMKNQHVTLEGTSTTSEVALSNNIEAHLNSEELAKIKGARFFEERLAEVTLPAGICEKPPGFLFEFRKRLIDARHEIGAADVCDLLIHEADKLRVAPDQVELHGEGTPVVEISNCSMGSLGFRGKANYRFSGKNYFGKLKGNLSLTHVSWGGYQSFSTGKDDVYENRTFFLQLKDEAEAKKDFMQSMIIQREIAKCQHGVFKRENITSSLQDRITFGFSRFVSNYGTSWLRALGAMLLLNFIALLLFAASEIWQEPARIMLISSLTDLRLHYAREFEAVKHAQTFGKSIGTWVEIYLELLNPVSRASTHFQVTGWWGTLLDGLHKFLYASIAYEFVKALRRFGRVR